MELLAAIFANEFNVLVVPQELNVASTDAIATVRIALVLRVAGVLGIGIATITP